MAKTDNRSHPFIYPVIAQAGGGPYVATLTGNLTVDHVGPRVLVLNTGASARVVTIPNATLAYNGDHFEVRNTGSSGVTLTVQDVATNSLAVLADGEVVSIYNARGTYSAYKTSAAAGSGSGSAFTSRTTTTDGVVGGTAKVVGGRFNDFTSAVDTITAAASSGAYIDFATSVPILPNTLKAGTRLSMLAAVVVSDAAAGAETLKTKLTIGPREAWTVVVDTATDEEDYGVDMVRPEAGSIAYTSEVATTVALIADGIAAAWNLDATCAAAATAVSDGVDTVTFTSITDRYFSIVEAENAAKMTTAQVTATVHTTLVETTAVDQAADDIQALDFEINSLEDPSVDSPLVGIGSWMTKAGVTLANNVTGLASTDHDTTGRLVIRAWALWSATAATTTARLNFLTVRGE